VQLIALLLLLVAGLKVLKAELLGLMENHNLPAIQAPHNRDTARPERTAASETPATETK
jgi:hypothetical protein